MQFFEPLQREYTPCRDTRLERSTRTKDPAKWAVGEQLVSPLKLTQKANSIYLLCGHVGLLSRVKAKCGSSPLQFK